MTMTARSARGDDLGRGPRAGLQRAVHVPDEDRRGLGAGPVDPTDRLPQRGPVLGPHTAREMRAVAAPGPDLLGPVELDVLLDVRGLRPEELDEAANHGV